MKRILLFMTLFIIGATHARADESSTRLANAIKKYQQEKQQKTTNSNMENQTEKDNSSDSEEKILERSLNTDPTNADPEPQG